MSAETYYPPAGFYFSVAVAGGAVDARFQEVSGISTEFTVQETADGGENRFVHKLPGRTHHGPLVLKRGVIPEGSELGAWIAATVGSSLTSQIIPRHIVVTLLDGSGEPLVMWGFSGAYPTRWQISDLNSMENRLLAETLEFSYQFYVKTTVGSGGDAAASLQDLMAKL